MDFNVTEWEKFIDLVLFYFLKIFFVFDADHFLKSIEFVTIFLVLCFGLWAVRHVGS